MCFGNREIYTECGCEGNFIVTSRCRLWNGCRNVVEDGMVHIQGLCRRCQHVQNQGYPRDHRPVPLPGSGNGKGSRFRCMADLETHFRRKVRGLRAFVAAAEARYRSSGSRRDYGDLQGAIAELAEAEREFRREVELYRAEEERLDDLESYEGW